MCSVSFLRRGRGRTLVVVELAPPWGASGHIGPHSRPPMCHGLEDPEAFVLLCRRLGKFASVDVACGVDKRGQVVVEDGRVEEPLVRQGFQLEGGQCQWTLLLLLLSLSSFSLLSLSVSISISLLYLFSLSSLVSLSLSSFPSPSPSL